VELPINLAHVDKNATTLPLGIVLKEGAIRYSDGGPRSRPPRQPRHALIDPDMHTTAQHPRLRR
jgi:hypothetical protein